jgi:acyl-CoA synthetase (AMP-forming)/AMP-acid ligase II
VATSSTTEHAWPEATSTPSFAARLEAHGERPAVIGPDGATWTYRELARRADEVAERIGPGRRLVAVEAGADPSSLVAYLGALRGGHAVLVLPPGDGRGPGALLDAWDPDVVVRESGPSSDDATIEVDVRRDTSEHRLHPDLCLLLSTSGSTGSPKLVRLGVEGVQANAASIATYLGLRGDDRAAMTLPMHYCYGLSVVNSHLAVGASVLLGGGSVVDRCFWDRFRAHRCTSFAGVPHTFELLDRAGFEDMAVPTLRYVTQAGGRLDPRTVVRYGELGRSRGWDLFVMYGQTEATARMAYLPPEMVTEHPTAIGRAIPGGELRVEPTPSAAGTPLVDGEVGELVYRGHNVMLGYALTRDDLALGREVEELRTGDLARQTPDGLFEVVGRTSRFVKLFGVRVDLDRVEDILAEGGLEALCVGTDAELVLGVVGDADDAAQAVADVRVELGLPRSSVHAVSLAEIPRLPNGKPDRDAVLRAGRAGRAVRPSEASGPSTADDAAPTGEPRWGRRRRDRRGATVREVYAEVLGVDHVADGDTFVSLGGDSLSYVEVSTLLEESVGDLPESWHTTPVAELESRSRPASGFASVEGNVMLRAVAIALIVGTHASLFRVQGGAHLLLAVAGYNFARFRLGLTEQAHRVRRDLASIARIAVPVVLWVSFMFTWREPFSVPRLLLIDNVAGDGLWRYWYAEVLVQLLLGLTLLFGVRSVREAERRRPFAFCAALLGATLAIRFGWSPIGEPAEAMYRTDTVAWFFVLGWAVQRASTNLQRALVTAALVVSVPGFFDSPQRGVVVGVGLVLLVWVPRVKVPRPLNRWVGAVAAASLAIFLTHFAVLPWLRPHLPPAAVFVAALATGVAIDLLGARVRPGERLARAWAGISATAYRGGYTSTGSGRTTTSTSPSEVRLAGSTGSSPDGVRTTSPSLTPRTTSPRPMNSATREFAGER